MLTHDFVLEQMRKIIATYIFSGRCNVNRLGQSVNEQDHSVIALFSLGQAGHQVHRRERIPSGAEGAEDVDIPQQICVSSVCSVVNSHTVEFEKPRHRAYQPSRNTL